jgi:hypothetical protein
MPCRPDHVLRDRGSIIPTIYLCFSRTEALLMVSNTSYHKHLHGLHRFTLFAACKSLALLAHDLRREGSILLCFKLGCHRLFKADARVTRRADHGSD